MAFLSFGVTSQAQPIPQHQMDAIGRMETSIGKLTETVGKVSDKVGDFQADLATVKSDQENQQRKIFEIETSNSAGFNKINESIEKLSVRVEMRDRPKWMVWVTTLGFIFVVLTSAVTVGSVIVNGNIREQTSPLQAQIAQIQTSTATLRELETNSARSREADASSEKDRAELNRRIGVDEQQLATHLAASAEQFARLSAAFVENETQYRDLKSLVYYLWAEVTGKTFPIITRENPSTGPGYGAR